MGRKLQAIIDSAALKHNVQRVRYYAPGKAILAMIKANAYGHGLIESAQLLAQSGVDAFGVACLEEALELRCAGINQPIVLCEGFFSADELPEIVANQLDVVVHHEFQIESLLAMPVVLHANKPINVWIKLDTGFNRLGFRPQQLDAVLQALRAAQQLRIIGIMTHFANADDPQDTKTQQQIQQFQQAIIGIGNKIASSMANSAAILAWPAAHADWVRPGLMLYGVSPLKDRLATDFGLRSVMTLISIVLAIKTAQRGETIGYSGRFVCPETMPIGVIAIGYGDGYSSLIPDGTPVIINGKLAKIVGRVSMDMAVVDLRGHYQAKIGDQVILWGSAALPLEIVAKHAGIIPYELLTALGNRVQRCYLNKATQQELYPNLTELTSKF